MLSPSERVREQARSLGFHLIGIAPAQPFQEAEPRYAQWVAEGRHGEMGWFDQDRVRRSTHPDELLPGAQSIVALGISYYADEPDSGGDGGPRGKIARYAQGLDYHDVLKDRVDRLATFIREVGGPDTRTRVFVDTAPLLDREAAVRSGLGFYGKNTNMLTGPLGSYVLLGTVMTTLELNPDQAIARDCGQCRLCIDACPTDAIVEPYVLDARRCIAYLTIELRDPIPRDLRAAMGERIFGCDICQEVCPWNRRLDPLAWPELRPPTIEHAQPELTSLLSLDDDAFRQRYRGTAITRAKRRGLLRNAAVALGNSGDERSTPALTRALEDPEPQVRGHAAWALGMIGGAHARHALVEALAVEPDEWVREEIEAALAMRSADAASAPQRSAEDSDPPGRH